MVEKSRGLHRLPCRSDVHRPHRGRHPRFHGSADQHQARPIRALTAQQTTHKGKKLGQILLESGKITAQDVEIALAGQFGFEYIDLSSLELPPEVISAIQPATANSYKVVPVGYDPGARALQQG